MDISPVIQQLAQKYNLTQAHINVIAHSQFAFLKSTVASGTEENIKLRHIGKFCIKPIRRYIYNNIKTFLRERRKQQIHEREKQQQTTGDIQRMEEPNIPKP